MIHGHWSHNDVSLEIKRKMIKRPEDLPQMASKTARNNAAWKTKIQMGGNG
jgi:hypothetical protein